MRETAGGCGRASATFAASWSRSTRPTCTEPGLARRSSDVVAGIDARGIQPCSRCRLTSPCPRSWRRCSSAWPRSRFATSSRIRARARCGSALRAATGPRPWWSRTTAGASSPTSPTARAATSASACSPTSRATPVARSRIDSEPGRGTRIELEAGRVIRVLIVEDHALVRAGLEELLSGAEDIDVVGVAGDGAEAIELAAAEEPDVVLMDLSMPVVDGIEATRRIRATQQEVARRRADLVLRSATHPRGARRRSDRLPAQGRGAGRALPRRAGRGGAGRRRWPRRRHRRC